jgi:hypothetical protein
MIGYFGGNKDDMMVGADQEFFFGVVEIIMLKKIIE